MTIQTITRGNTLVVQPVGDLSSHTAVEFESLLTAAIEDGMTRMVFDCSELTHISSDGLRVMLGTLKSLRALHGDASLVALSEEIHGIFSAGGFFALLEEFETVDEAIRAMDSDDE